MLFAREGPGGITAGAFLVDLGCLGIKDCFALVEEDAAAYRGFVEEIAEHDRFVACDPALGVKIVRAAEEFASRLGFHPARGYAKVRKIFGDIDPADCETPVRCGGERGRPHYVAGPSDDTRRVLRHLEAKFGRHGFDFTVEASAFDAAAFVTDDEDGGDDEYDDEAVEDTPLDRYDDPVADPATRMRVAAELLGLRVLAHALDRFGKPRIESTWNEYWGGGTIPVVPDQQPESSACSSLRWSLRERLSGAPDGRIDDATLREGERQVRRHFFDAIRTICGPREPDASAGIGGGWLRATLARASLERRVRRATLGHRPPFLRSPDPT